MTAFYVIGGVALLLLLSLTVFSYIIHLVVFKSEREKCSDAYRGLEKSRYAPHAERMRECIDRMLELPYKPLELISHDGLKLRARYYEGKDTMPCIIFAHGYKCNPIRDLSPIMIETLNRGYGALLIDQRAHGESEGNVIGFGLTERQDVLGWSRLLSEMLGDSAKIILYGMSMGAATVLLASGLDLPSSVKGVIADCPYSSATEIIGEVGKRLHVPSPLTRLGARIGAALFGGFRLCEDTPTEAARRTNKPILLIHGNRDTFVPFYMSEEIAKASGASLYAIDEAEHAVCYLCDSDGYISKMTAFIERLTEEKQ